MANSKLFELRGDLSKKEETLIEIVGAVFVVIMWHIVAEMHIISAKILPPPLEVLQAFYDLFMSGKLWRNTKFSLFLNLTSCLEAAIISIPLGFLFGLFPLFRAFSQRYLGASRFLPLPAVLGLFINAFGIYSNMKIQFLAASIIVYLVPMVAQRVSETPQVYLDMMKTLGASKWQTIRHIFIPDVLSRVWVDIGVVMAISWTYITIVEKINDAEGGLGAQIAISARNDVAAVYAGLIALMLIAFILDKTWLWLDKRIFKFKAGGK